MKRPSFFMVLMLCLLAAGCGDTEPGTGSPKTSLPSAIKGYEMYSWLGGGNWHFTLITGTNRLKTVDEIVSEDCERIDEEWVQITVTGIEPLESLLRRLPADVTIYWMGERWASQFTGSGDLIDLPSSATVEQIRAYSRQHGVHLTIVE